MLDIPNKFRAMSVDMLPDEASTYSQHRRNLKGEGYNIHVEVVYALPERQYKPATKINRAVLILDLQTYPDAVFNTSGRNGWV